MARIRMTHPEQWFDDDFVEMSPWARLLAIALRNEADDQGVVEDKPRRLKNVLFPADDVDITALLNECVKHKQVCRYEVDGRGYLAIRNFCEYQTTKKPTRRYPLPEELWPYVGMTEDLDAKLLGVKRKGQKNPDFRQNQTPNDTPPKSRKTDIEEKQSLNHGSVPHQCGTGSHEGEGEGEGEKNKQAKPTTESHPRAHNPAAQTGQAWLEKLNSTANQPPPTEPPPKTEPTKPAATEPDPPGLELAAEWCRLAQRLWPGDKPRNPRDVQHWLEREARDCGLTVEAAAAVHRAETEAKARRGDPPPISHRFCGNAIEARARQVHGPDWRLMPRAEAQRRANDNARAA